MRRVRFRDVNGRAHTGEWTDAGIEFGGDVYDPDEVDVLPPTEPSKVIGVSTNNWDLLEEHDYDESELPDRPRIFIKTPNAVVGHRDTIKLIPDKEFDFEGELAVVIGEECRNVSRDEAMDVIAGYTCANDITNHSDRDYYGVRLKATDDTCPIGPVVASPELVPDDASIELRVDGETKQQTTLDRLRFTIPEIIEDVTTYMTLQPGDVIPTGSPSGIEQLRDGDTVEIEIEGIGTLEHGVSITDG